MSNSTNQSYIIQPYSPEALRGILEAKDPSLEDHVHIDYLIGYFEKAPKQLRPKTIVLELSYISISFLEDYANYFSLSFNQISKFCRRVHLFSIPFDDEVFEHILLNHPSAQEMNEARLREAYLGHLVLRPLPSGIIGASIIKPHISQPEAQYQLPATRDYRMHLFGVELQLNSLVFQSQDHVVSSCSTIALWCAFSKTSELFRTHRPSPSRITISANNLYLRNGRSLPTSGLDPYQICTAIEATGLVTEMREEKLVNIPKMAKAFIYGYLSFGIPVLLGIKIQNSHDDLNNRHLLTVVGYKPPMTWIKGHEQVERDSFRLRAFDIQEFMVHDDLLGPFTSIEIYNDEKKISRPPDTPKPTHQESELIDTLFVPVDPLIRITFEQAYFLTQKFWGYIHYLHFVKEGVLQHESWDLRLIDSNKYKDDIRRRPIDPICEKAKKELLLTALPRYMWVARAFIAESLQLDLIYDATDSHINSCCTIIAIWNSDLREKILEDFHHPDFEDFLTNIVELDHKTVRLLHKAVV